MPAALRQRARSRSATIRWWTPAARARAWRCRRVDPEGGALAKPSPDALVAFAVLAEETASGPILPGTGAAADVDVQDEPALRSSLGAVAEMPLCAAPATRAWPRYGVGPPLRHRREADALLAPPSSDDANTASGSGVTADVSPRLVADWGFWTMAIPGLKRRAWRCRRADPGVAAYVLARSKAR